MSAAAVQPLHIERGHFTIAVALFRKLAERNPTEHLMQVNGRDLRGSALVAYLDSLPDSRIWMSDCPKPRLDGACGCFDQEVAS